jgi:hypothetical protein
MKRKALLWRGLEPIELRLVRVAVLFEEIVYYVNANGYWSRQDAALMLYAL